MIQIDNLLFTYGLKKPLFDQLHLSLLPGHIYGLLGKNGAGKSTLLKIICGLLFPKDGSVSVLGFQPEDRAPQLLQEVYLITEEFELLNLRIDQYVRLYSPFYPRFDHQLLETYLQEFQLAKDQKLTTLSYGQKKKFLLSFGLATDCKLVILDEPTNGLDIPSKSQFRKVVASAIHEERTFIISTHQVRDVENLIDPIIILDEGEIVFHESYERINQKLTVNRQAKLPDEHETVYAESHFGSYMVVRENTTGADTNINLETLFNTVINSKERVYQLFNP